LKRYVPKEHELDTFEKDAEKIENQDFQIIRDPSEVQNCIKLAWSTENEILGLFSTSNAFHRQERIGILPKLQQLKKNSDKLRIPDDINLLSMINNLQFKLQSRQY
jgi:hypothetical protein